MSSPEDLTAKRRFIEAYFEDLDQKACFTDRLNEKGHKDEALLLCCCYIEAVGNGLAATSAGYAENFASVLMEHGGEPVLALIHPRKVKESLPYKSTSPASKAALVGALLTLPTNQTLTADEFLTAMQQLITPDAFEFLKKELWRGSIASIVYSRIRSPGVHTFGPAKSLIFSATTYKDKLLPEVDFPMLRRVLARVIAHAEQVSLSTNRLFGQL